MGVYEGLTAAELWEKHQDGIQRFREHRQTQPLDHLRLREPSAFLARMDRLFDRLLPKRSN